MMLLGQDLHPLGIAMRLAAKEVDRAARSSPRSTEGCAFTSSRSRTTGDHCQ